MVLTIATRPPAHHFAGPLDSLLLPDWSEKLCRGLGGDVGVSSHGLKEPKQRAVFRGQSPLRNGAEVAVFDKKAPAISLAQYRARMAHVVRSARQCLPSVGLRQFIQRRSVPLPAYAENIQLGDLDTPEFVLPKMDVTDETVSRVTGHRLFSLVDGRPTGFVTFCVSFVASAPSPDGAGKLSLAPSLGIRLELREAFVCPEYRKVGLGDFLAETASFVCLQQMDAVSRRLTTLGPMPTQCQLVATPSSAAGLRFVERMASHFTEHAGSTQWHLKSFSDNWWNGATVCPLTKN